MILSVVKNVSKFNEVLSAVETLAAEFSDEVSTTFLNQKRQNRQLFRGGRESGDKDGWQG